MTRTRISDSSRGHAWRALHIRRRRSVASLCAGTAAASTAAVAEPSPFPNSSHAPNHPAIAAVIVRSARRGRTSRCRGRHDVVDRLVPARRPAPMIRTGGSPSNKNTPRAPATVNISGMGNESQYTPWRAQSRGARGVRTGSRRLGQLDRSRWRLPSPDGGPDGGADGGVGGGPDGGVGVVVAVQRGRREVRFTRVGA